MIRIVHVVGVMNYGGAENFIMNVYRNINRDKIQFDFICTGEKQGNYETEIKKLGGKIFKVNSPNKGRIKNLYEIYKILKNNKDIKVVHSHISFYSGWINLIAYLAKIKIRIAHAHTSNDIRKINIIRKIYNNFSRLMINKFSNVKLACGKAAGEYLFSNNTYKIINNGIDLEKYENVTDEKVSDLKKEFNILDNEFIIGHVGRFEKVKNQEYFIELAKCMQETKRQFKIVLVGNGTERENIKNKISKERLDKYFILPGNRNDINIFMKMFNVFVMPSLYEGFPLVVVEALAGDNICYLSNNISKETNIVENRVYFFNIKDNPKGLIEQIYRDIKTKEKVNIYDLLQKQGYSIKNTAKEIEKIYLNGERNL